MTTNGPPKTDTNGSVERSVRPLADRLRDEIARTVELDLLHHDAAAEIESQKTIIDGYARIYSEAMSSLRETVAERERLRALIDGIKSDLIDATLPGIGQGSEWLEKQLIKRMSAFVHASDRHNTKMTGA